MNKDKKQEITLKNIEKSCFNVLATNLAKTPSSASQENLMEKLKGKQIALQKTSALMQSLAFHC